MFTGHSASKLKLQCTGERSSVFTQKSGLSKRLNSDCSVLNFSQASILINLTCTWSKGCVLQVERAVAIVSTNENLRVALTPVSVTLSRALEELRHRGKKYVRRT